ncbi:MAG: glycosyltransferase family 4 protein [Nitrospirae bacterium]|nr:glycosyltransferase family 4 protein [Nitrospirota bacterium]
MNVFYPVPEFMFSPQARFIQIINTANSIAKTGSRVKLISGKQHGVDKKGIFDYFDVIPQDNLEMVFLPILRRNSHFWPPSIGMVFNVSLLAYLIAHRGEGVVFVRHPKLAACLARWQKYFKMPIIFESHEIFHLTTEKPEKKKKFKDMESFVYDSVDGIITISSQLREELGQIFHVNGKPIVIIPNALRSELIRSEAIPEQRGEYVFYAGGLYPWKGVGTLIHAMEHLPGEKLLIVGGGDNLKELTDLAKKLGLNGRVSFTGSVSQKQVMGYMGSAKIAVIPNVLNKPSTHSSPLKMFEFMAKGLPIVASNIPGISDVLTDGVNVMLFEPGDVRALASAIKYLVENPATAAALGENARRLAQNYTYEKRAERIISFIKDATG